MRKRLTKQHRSSVVPLLFSLQIISKKFSQLKKRFIFAPAMRKLLHLTGGMAERSNAAVLKTVDCNRSGGSNPSSSASI